MTAHSRLLQILLDAERPIRVSVGHVLENPVRCLHLLGLLDYRKSGWWATSEAGHRLVGGSLGGVPGFLEALEAHARRAAQQAEAAPSRRLAHKEQVKRRRVAAAANEVLAWIQTGRA